MNRKMGLSIKSRFYGEFYQIGLIAFLVIVAIALTIVKPQFIKMANISSMLTQFPEFGIMTFGSMLAMITGGFDLSVVSVANLSAIISAKVMLNVMGSEGTFGAGTFVLIIIAALLIGTVCGAVNGYLISVLHIPPMLATMGSNELIGGIALIITNGKAVSGLPVDFSMLMTSKIGGIIPISALIFIVLALVVNYILTRTRFGNEIYMLGTNSKAALFSGLRIKSLLIRTYMLSGIMASVAGLIMLANYNSAKADYGSTYSLQCILICVLGGVSPKGGKGKVLGVVLAIIILQVLSSGLNMFSELNTFYRTLLWGVVLIAVMILNYYLERKGK